MTGPEHYKKAEEYLEKASGSLLPQYDGYVARATAHAILADAAATAFLGHVAASEQGHRDADLDAWNEVAGAGVRVD